MLFSTTLGRASSVCNYWSTNDPRFSGSNSLHPCKNITLIIVDPKKTRHSGKTAMPSLLWPCGLKHDPLCPTFQASKSKRREKKRLYCIELQISIDYIKDYQAKSGNVIQHSSYSGTAQSNLITISYKGTLMRLMFHLLSGHRTQQANTKAVVVHGQDKGSKDPSRKVDSASALNLKSAGTFPPLKFSRSDETNMWLHYYMLI